MKSKKLLWVIALLPMIITLIVLPMLPDTIPAHYNINGVVNRWGSKYETLLLPVFTILMILFLKYMEKVGGKQEDSSAQNAKVLLVTSYMVALIFNAITYWILYSAYMNVENLYESSMDWMRIIAIITSASFIFFGNILPKCKQNKTIGIRTKWTLENETVWYKTHRFAGKIIMIFGIVSMIMCLTFLKNMTAFIVAFGGFILISVGIVIYSYVIFNNLSNKN